MIDYDFGWPTTESISTDGDIQDFIAMRVEARLADPRHKAIVADHVIRRSVDALNALAVHDVDATAWGAYAWLQSVTAGEPIVSIVEGTARQDARFWAETATPIEWECYALAACDKLSGNASHALFASRQIKRLAGALFRRMSPDEQAAFAKWINEQISGKTE